MARKVRLELEADGDTRQTLVARAPTLDALAVWKVRLANCLLTELSHLSNCWFGGRNTGNLSLMLQTAILIEGKEWTGELRVVACRVGKMDSDVASSFAPELRG